MPEKKLPTPLVKKNIFLQTNYVRFTSILLKIKPNDKGEAASF